MMEQEHIIQPKTIKILDVTLGKVAKPSKDLVMPHDKVRESSWMPISGARIMWDKQKRHL